MNIFSQKKRRLFQCILALALVFAASTTWAQSTSKIAQNEVIEASQNSRLMARKMDYRVILPFNYNRDKNKRFPVIYLLHGRTGNYKDWANLTKIEEYSVPYNFIIVMPDGGTNGWYSDSAITPNDKYDSYFIRELIPEIEKKYRAAKNRQDRIVAGLSMGGYGAMKFGLKYPEKFIIAGSFSGAFDAVVKTEKYPHLVESVKGVFGEQGSPARTENDIFKMVSDASPEKIKTFPFLFIDCGTEDHQTQTNRDFVQLLTDKKVPHEYRQMPGEHNWKFWDSEIQEFLQAANNIISRQPLPKTKNN